MIASFKAVIVGGRLTARTVIISPSGLSTTPNLRDSSGLVEFSPMTGAGGELVEEFVV